MSAVTAVAVLAAISSTIANLVLRYKIVNNTLSLLDF